MNVEVPEWALAFVGGIVVGYFGAGVLGASDLIREIISRVIEAVYEWVKRRRFMLEYYGDLAVAAKAKKGGAPGSIEGYLEPDEIGDHYVSVGAGDVGERVK
jgi:hypothetical protein